MIISIIGSRSLNLNLNKYIKIDKISKIITGGALGIDKCAEKFARENKISLEIIRPDYETYGIRAPAIRNRKIVDLCDSLIAFWDGVSRGTKMTIDFAISSKKLTTVFFLKNGIIQRKDYDFSNQLKLFWLFRRKLFL